MMFSVKQQKFILARIADYDNRLKALETRLQAEVGSRVSAMEQIPAANERPVEQGQELFPSPDATELRSGK